MPTCSLRLLLEEAVKVLSIIQISFKYLNIPEMLLQNQRLYSVFSLQQLTADAAIRRAGYAGEKADDFLNFTDDVRQIVRFLSKQAVICFLKKIILYFSQNVELQQFV